MDVIDTGYMTDTKRGTIIVQNIQSLFNDDMRCKEFDKTPRCSSPSRPQQIQNSTEIFPSNIHGGMTSYIKFCRRLDIQSSSVQKKTKGRCSLKNGLISGLISVKHNRHDKVTDDFEQLASDARNMMFLYPTGLEILRRPRGLTEEQHFECRNGFHKCSEC